MAVALIRPLAAWEPPYATGAAIKSKKKKKKKKRAQPKLSSQEGQMQHMKKDRLQTK